MDVVLYLTYLRYSATMFGVIAFINMVTLLPAFLAKGNEEEKRDGTEIQEFTLLQRMTIVNNTSDYYLMWAVFLFTIMYSMFGHMLLHLFEEKRRSEKLNTASDPGVISEVELANHSILLRGINPKVSPEIV